jgi:hypothetical protein
MLHVFSTNRVKLWYTHNKSDNLLETQGVDCFKRGLKIITRYTCIINMKRTKFIHKCTYTDLIISRIFGKKKNLPQPIMNRVPSSWLFLSFTYYHRKRWLIVSMAARPGGFDATPLLSWWRAAIVHRLYTDRGPLEFGGPVRSHLSHVPREYTNNGSVAQLHHHSYRFCHPPLLRRPLFYLIVFLVVSCLQ